MLNEKNMPNYYWAEACATALYMLNKTPTTAIHESTPEMRLTGYRPDIGHLKVFGCIAYVHVRDELRKKLDPKAEKCIFIGYAQDRKAYKCYNLNTRQVVISRDVVFDELASWYKDKVDVMVDDIDSDIHVNLPNEVSTSLTRPTGLSDSSSVNPWNGRLRNEHGSTSSSVVDKGKKKVEGIGITGYESSGSERLDEELGIPSVRTPGVRQERYVPPHARRFHSAIGCKKITKGEISSGGWIG